MWLCVGQLACPILTRGFPTTGRVHPAHGPLHRTHIIPHILLLPPLPLPPRSYRPPPPHPSSNIFPILPPVASRFPIPTRTRSKPITLYTSVRPPSSMEKLAHTHTHTHICCNDMLRQVFVQGMRHSKALMLTKLLLHHQRATQHSFAYSERQQIHARKLQQR